MANGAEHCARDWSSRRGLLLARVFARILVGDESQDEPEGVTGILYGGLFHFGMDYLRFDVSC